MDFSQFENGEIIKVIHENLHFYELVRDSVLSIIKNDPVLKKNIHSLKYRTKDYGHLDEKINRKNRAIEQHNSSESVQKGDEEALELITPDNVLTRITDIIGVRLLHLNMGQFHEIHDALKSYIEQGHISLYETPKAYSWDPEYVSLFKELGVDAHLKESLYTSVHYVLKTREDLPYTVELQVRTLFEEVWGEIDHQVNYPKETESIAVKEQLKVLARVVSAGTRLSDSIFKIQQSEE